MPSYNPRPLIGITCGTSSLDPSAKNLQDRLNQAYSKALLQAGAIPVILPNVVETETAVQLLERLDGLLLSGGYDFHPSAYGENILNETVEIDAPRDEAEIPLIKAALDRDMPLLAICRGIQSLNVAMGGTLYQDIPAQTPSELKHSQKESRDTSTHVIGIEPNSCLALAIGSTEMAVNSFHHQSLKDVGKGLKVIARAEDGIVEAVEGDRETFLLGVQFHPEEMVGNSEAARRIFSAFVEAAGRE
jgi:putative glutamine amidotransferase